MKTAKLISNGLSFSTTDKKNVFDQKRQQMSTFVNIFNLLPAVFSSGSDD
jgi:hypothetical protein